MAAAILIAIGVACALYGAAVMAPNSGTLFFAVWFALAAGFLGLGLACKAGVIAALPAPVRVAGLAVLVAGALAVAGLSCASLSGMGQQPDEDADALVVLGAQVRADGPSNVLRYRLDAAADYYRNHPGVRIICSGGQGYNEPTTEARAMADYLADHGVPRSALELEDQSTNTVQNLQYSAKLLDPKNDRVVVVTNGFHLFRAMGLARKLGYAHVSGLPATSDAFYLPNNVLREALGIAKDLAAGNL
ncbi:MAG: YdcF family protein [Coriobacteriia bacterium]|nr:YdcF family protein [Coriobacteriia bacterium]